MKRRTTITLIEGQDFDEEKGWESVVSTILIFVAILSCMCVVIGGMH